MAKLQEANTKRAATFTVFPQPTAPPASYSTRPYVGRGRSFNDRRGYKKSGGPGRGQGRSTPSATSTKSGQSKEGQTTMTVSVPSDSNKRKVESRDSTPQAPRKNKRNFRGDKNQGKNNEGVLPPQLTPVGGRLSKFVEGWKRITNDPYVLSIVAKEYRLRFTSPPLLSQTPWEIRSLQGLEEILGMWEQITLMLQKNAITEVPPNSPGFYSNIFLVRKASGGWRPVIDLKNLNAHIHAPHFRLFSTNSVLSSVRKGDYAFKIDLQDAYFHVPIHPSSRKYLRFTFENKVYQFRVLPFSLNTAPQIFTRLGHTVTGYLHRLGISVIPYLDDWSIHHPDRQVLLQHQAQLLSTLDLVGFILNRKKSELDLVQDLQFLGIRLRLDLGEASLPESKAWEIVARTRHLSSLLVLTYHQVSQLLGSHNWASGETPSTSFSFIRSDRPVYATASIRSTGPCQPSTALAGPTFSYLRNPYPHILGGIHDFYRRFHPVVGRSHLGFPDFGYLDPYRPQAPYQLSGGVQGGSLCPTALGSIAPGPPGYDRYGQLDSSFVYQQARRDPFPHLATFDSRASPLVRGSEHNSPSKTYSRLSERDSRPPISSESANTDRVESPPRDCEPHLWVLGDTSSRHVRDCVELPPSLVHVSNFGDTSPSGGCSVSGLAGEVNVHVSSIPSAQQSHSGAPVHPGGRSNSHRPWWPKQSWFPHLLHLCVDHLLFFPYRRDLLSQ